MQDEKGPPLGETEQKKIQPHWKLNLKEHKR